MLGASLEYICNIVYGYLILLISLNLAPIVSLCFPKHTVAIGYFPTYLIGALMAAQLAHYCKKDIPDMDEKVERGEFEEIKNWLTSKVHVHGKRYKSLDELLVAQVGEPLNTKYFIDNLTQKYTELYKVA